MGKVEKISIALTDEMLASVKEAVASGDYASSSEVIRHALRDWKAVRESGKQRAVTPKKDAEKVVAAVKAIQERVAKLGPMPSMKEMDDWLYGEDGLPH